MMEDERIYMIAKRLCHRMGMEWTDPRTCITYPPPDAMEMPMAPLPDDFPDRWGNFLIRLGYLTGCLHDPAIQDELMEYGATAQQIADAYTSLMALANCFYQMKSKGQRHETRTGG